MTATTWVQDELRQSGVTFEEHHHTESYTAQSVAQREHVSGHRVAKVVIVMADNRPVECILPASRHVVLERVRDILAAKQVRLASEDEIARHFTDCELGAIPALRHWKDTEVLMDASLRVQGNILIQGGTHCDAMVVPFNQWFRMVQPRVEQFSELRLSWPRDSYYDEDLGK